MQQGGRADATSKGGADRTRGSRLPRVASQRPTTSVTVGGEPRRGAGKFESEQDGPSSDVAQTGADIMGLWRDWNMGVTFMGWREQSMNLPDLAGSPTASLDLSPPPERFPSGGDDVAGRATSPSPPLPPPIKDRPRDRKEHWASAERDAVNLAIKELNVALARVEAAQVVKGLDAEQQSGCDMQGRLGRAFHEVRYTLHFVSEDLMFAIGRLTSPSVDRQPTIGCGKPNVARRRQLAHQRNGAEWTPEWLAKPPKSDAPFPPRKAVMPPSAHAPKI